MEKKNYGWTAKGILGITFSSISLVFIFLGILLWKNKAGKDGEYSVLFLYVFGGIGLAFLLPGLGLLLADLRRRALMRRAYEGGYCVMAKTAGVRTRRDVLVNGRYPVTVVCRYTDPATDTEHVWFSRYLYADAESLQVPDEVPVYIDRMNGNIGFVDIDAVLPETRTRG